MSMKAIVEIIESLTGIHKELYTLGEQKVEPIKKGDMSALEVLVREESKLVRKLQATEGLRTKVVKNFLMTKGEVTENATMTDIRKYATKEEEQQLEQIQNELLNQVQNLKRQNELNQLLIEESLRFVNLSLDLMVPHKEDISYKRPHEQDDSRYDTGHSLFDSKA
ncbi:flagellar protein FlgN [Halalkalibacter nanhaiisediminis]|uniref:FlgN protein n=1 Tax=Halalkalibacter nanhaiisediminis TaxID=688079 RepID=A0A562QT90_9BACI|nr:flagellar protein FlgN [Halalkalibacter nanhaiisediminis]TWI59945.1 FlgN protein [Halalkalibacter nanhaiisediminis]